MHPSVFLCLSFFYALPVAADIIESEETIYDYILSKIYTSAIEGSRWRE